MMSCLMAEYVLIIKKFCKYYIFNLIIPDIKQILTIANPQGFWNFNDIKKLSESFEQIDSKYWTNWQGVLNKLTLNIEQILKFPKIEFFAKFCSKLVRFYIKILQIVQFLLILCSCTFIFMPLYLFLAASGSESRFIK